MALAAGLLIGLLSTASATGQHVVELDPLTPQEELERFHLPPGFEIQLVAAEPEIAKPINLKFDRQGRLYVTQSVEYPYAAKGRGRDAVVRLTIDPAGGRARRVETLVDGLNIPIGVTPVPEGVIVFSIPNIYLGQDTTGDGKIDRRDVLFGEFGFVDTHGMNNAFTHWIDGWVYACHGFRNQSTVAGRDGHQLSMNSGNTYRFRPDGTRIESFSFGQVNPFGLCFDPLGNMLTADCHSKPGYLVLRGAHYPTFGLPNDGLGLGPVLMEHNHGSSGIAGVAYYDAEQFPPKYRHTIFIGNPITGRVHHDRLDVHGSTYEAVEQPDLVRSDDPWFRPVDVQLGPDGALYIADFYNRIIGHYEVPLNHPGRDRRRGRIWRIVYQGGADRSSAPMPDLGSAALEQLLERLDDENLTVRTLATHELVHRMGRAAVEPVRRLVSSESSAPRARAHGLWVLERLGELDSALVARLANDPDRLVRVHLVKALAERGTWNAATADLVRTRLADGDAFVRRAAADALGLHPHPEQVMLLLELWANTPARDTHLIHVVRIALRDHLLQPDVIAGLEPRVFEKPGHVQRLLDVCLGARTAASADFVLRHLAGGTIEERKVGSYLHFAVRYGAEDRLPATYELAGQYQARPVDVQLAVIEALKRGLAERGSVLPARFEPWALRLGRELLADSRPAEVRRGIGLARELKLKQLYEPLARVAESRAGELADLRSAAIEACVDSDAERSVALVRRVLADSDESLTLRQKSASSLGGINTPAAREALAESLRWAPQSLAETIAAGLAASQPGAKNLLSLIADGKASSRLLQRPQIVQAVAAWKLPGAEEELARLAAGLPPADEPVSQLLAQRREGFLAARSDLGRGQAVFAKTCAACHRIGEVGHKIGPELDGIGHRGLERVLEDVLDPSRNVDGAFHTTTITTVGGRVLSGLVLRQEGEVLILADAEGKPVRVAVQEIDQRKTSPLSPMPANVPELIAESDFYHLVAFLLSQRQSAAPTAP